MILFRDVTVAASLCFCLRFLLPKLHAFPVKYILVLLGDKAIKVVQF